MNLAKYLKGSTTMGELMDMPNKYIQVIYKQYYDMLMDKDKAAAHAQEEAGEEIIDAMT